MKREKGKGKRDGAGGGFPSPAFFANFAAMRKVCLYADQDAGIFKERSEWSRNIQEKIIGKMKDRKLLNIELGRVTPEQYRELPESGVVVVLDNIRSAHNVGSAFRTCDSFKIDKLWLCGICAVPPSAEIHKSALGAEDSVPWEHSDDTMSVVRRLREEGYIVVSVEQTVNSVSLENFTPEPGGKYALVFGNEVDGVDQNIVDASDFSLEIPQFGTKHSLNISVSAGVVLWHFTLSRLRSELK